MDGQPDATVREASDEPHALTLAELDAALDRSAAEFSAGLAIPLDPVLRELRDMAERLRQKQSTEPGLPTRSS